MVAASGTLVLLSALGATIGSPLTAAAMDLFGPGAFYSSIAMMLSSIVVFSIWRGVKRPEIAPGEAGDFVAMPPSPLTASLNPDVTLNEIEAAAAKEPEQIQTSFDKLVNTLESREN